MSHVFRYFTKVRKIDKSFESVPYSVLRSFHHFLHTDQLTVMTMEITLLFTKLQLIIIDLTGIMSKYYHAACRALRGVCLRFAHLVHASCQTFGTDFAVVTINGGYTRYRVNKFLVKFFSNIHTYKTGKLRISKRPGPLS